MLKLQYKIKLGRALNYDNPQRFSEKLQWYKVNYRNPIMHECVDKYKVRDFIKSKGLESTLVKLYARYNSIEEVEWDKLPDSFVIKTTNGGGGLNVVVCHDKNTLDINELNEKLQCKAKKSRYGGREWAYYGLEPGIIVEELLVNSENPAAGVNDYKIFCYNGHAKYIIVDTDRYIGHKRNFYDREWNNLHVLSDCPACDREIEKPSNLDEMLSVAEKLSEGFPYVRVDLYNNDGKIYFGELTFYPWSGYVQYSPDEWDFKFGEDFVLEKF
ncbi:MAG: carbonic anhydrase [Ruminococcaceae bacterium]|nr:carbonic anhydrase [Oscillospiraceae bacterium]